jgi:hypothetical protein
MPPRFPVFWATLVLFILVAASTWDALVAGFHLVVILPLVLLGQWCLRWVFLRFRSPLWLRRCAMLIPALIIAAKLFHTGGRDTQALRVVFAGNIPAGIHDLHLTEDAWTDYVVTAHFLCDPASLRAILESPPFRRSDYQPAYLECRPSDFPDLPALPEVHGIITYERTNMGKEGNYCTVQTDAAFSFACVVYAVD